MIKGINKSKASRKHISCECKCNFDGKFGITKNVDVSVKTR